MNQHCPEVSKIEIGICRGGRDLVEPLPDHREGAFERRRELLGFIHGCRHGRANPGDCCWIGASPSIGSSAGRPPRGLVIPTMIEVAEGSAPEQGQPAPALMLGLV